MTGAAGRSADQVIEDLIPRVIALRRELHRFPETAWEEKKTAAILRNWLETQGVAPRSLCGTGLVAELRSGRGRTLAVRSDIDALPIDEESGLPFSSRHPGKMHACGHDVHMAVVAGAAAVLNRLRNRFHGHIKFLFQPAEEEPPGGAQEMIKAGVLAAPKVDMIFGLHVNPSIPVGKIGLRDGPLMAGALDFDIEIVGKGGHSALPHLARDALLCGATLLTNLQTIVSRNIDPFEPAVISIGKMEGGSARNVLPASCRLCGTARALRTATLNKLRRRIKAMTYSLTKAFQCQARIDFGDGYPPLINDPRANSYLRTGASNSLGAGSVVMIKDPLLGGEDFARYLQYATGAMFHLGIRNRSIGATRAWHHPEFVADENAIAIGIRTLVNAAICYLDD